MDMSADDRSLRGTIVAAELCASKEDYHKAESALLNALGEVRKRKATRGESDD